MTQRGDGKVSFTFGSWLVHYGSVATMILGTMFFYHGKFVVLETTQAVHSKQIEVLHEQDDQLGGIIRDELRALRQEIKEK